MVPWNYLFSQFEEGIETRLDMSLFWMNFTDLTPMKNIRCGEKSTQKRRFNHLSGDQS